MFPTDINLLKETPPWEWPPAAKNIIAGTLKDKSQPEADRALAATFAGELVVMDDDLADLLLASLNDPSDPLEVRSAAAIAFGPALEVIETDGFDEDPYSEPPVTKPVFERIQQALRAIHDDSTLSTELRRRALEASVRQEQEWHPSAIRAALKSADELWQVTAVFCMRYVPGFEEEILTSLNSTNTKILAEAVLSAGQRAIQEAWPRISALLSSKKTDRHVLLSAISAAAYMENEDVGELLEAFSQSSDAEIAEVAEEALEEHEMFGAIPGEDADFDEDDAPLSNNGHGPKKSL
ncbi:MAG: hypothetical protein HY820_40145 [Acidobacteria bacterium]|nr:hypothetical protein [Acidobacteriota bacterium]